MAISRFSIDCPHCDTHLTLYLDVEDTAMCSHCHREISDEEIIEQQEQYDDGPDYGGAEDCMGNIFSDGDF